MMKKSNKVNLTETQKECVNISGNLLVKGISGSGKSLVLLERALALNAKAKQLGKTIKILLLTFTNSLAKYFNEQIFMSNLDHEMIEVKTIDGFASEIGREILKKENYDLITDTERKTYIENLITRYKETKVSIKHLQEKLDFKFLSDEFRWIKNKCIYIKCDYLNINRERCIGKIHLNEKEKEVIWQLFVYYMKYLEKNHLRDYEDIYRELVKKNELLPKDKMYDHILVDEAQDIGLVKIKLLKNLAIKSLSIALDRAQTIYASSFSWNELGITIPDLNIRDLNKTFRSTRQIIEFANNLYETNKINDPFGKEYTSNLIIPLNEGPLPQVVCCKNQKEYIVSLIKKFRADSELVIGVLVQQKRLLVNLEQWMLWGNIPYETIKKSDNNKLDYTVTDNKRVKLATIYAAKGLEFDIVIIPYFSEKYFGVKSEISNSDLEQAENIMLHKRSLLYVAITRAKQALYLTYSGKISSLIMNMKTTSFKRVEI